MTYLSILVIGIILLVMAVAGMVFKKHLIVDLIDYFSRNQIIINGPSNYSITINANSKDRETAWMVYAQMTTRIAAVEFNDQYDALIIVNDSLFKLFSFIRDKTVELPLTVVNNDRSNAISLYLSILNIGIRPYLSKWHIPVKQWHDNMKKKSDSLSILEIEQNMPNRTDALHDMHAMNSRMKEYAKLLLDIAKGEKGQREIHAPLWNMNDFGESANAELERMNTTSK